MFYLAQWRMDIEEEGVVNVPAAHLAKMGLIPADMIRLGNLVESRGEGGHRNGHERHPPTEIIVGFVERLP